MLVQFICQRIHTVVYPIFQSIKSSSFVHQKIVKKRHHRSIVIVTNSMILYLKEQFIINKIIYVIYITGIRMRDGVIRCRNVQYTYAHQRRPRIHIGVATRYYIGVELGVLSLPKNICYIRDTRNRTRIIAIFKRSGDKRRNRHTIKYKIYRRKIGIYVS